MFCLQSLIILFLCLWINTPISNSSQIPPAVVNQLFGMLMGRSPYATSGAEYSRLTQVPITQIHLSKASFGNELPSMLAKPFGEKAHEEIAELDHDLEEIRNTNKGMLEQVQKLKLSGTVPLLSKLYDPAKSGDLGIGSDAAENELSITESAGSMTGPKQFIQPISNRRKAKEYLKDVPFLTRYNRAYKTIEAIPKNFEYLKNEKPRYRPSEQFARMSPSGQLKQMQKEQMQALMPERGDIPPTNE